MTRKKFTQLEFDFEEYKVELTRSAIRFKFPKKDGEDGDNIYYYVSPLEIQYSEDCGGKYDDLCRMIEIKESDMFGNQILYSVSEKYPIKWIFHIIGRQRRLPPILELDIKYELEKNKQK